MQMPLCAAEREGNMATFHIEFFSESLLRPVSFRVLLPNDVRIPAEELAKNPHYRREPKTLFLLHGYTNASGEWYYGSSIRFLAEKYHLAVVFPNGENGFYLKWEATGHRYCDFVGSELVEYMRKTFGLAKSAQDTFIGGLSMGGFGALHTAFAFPENFGKVAAMSSALIVHGIAGMKPGQDNGVANYEYYRSCFGDLDRVEESDANPETLLLRLKGEKKKIPGIFMVCGTQDFLLENNRAFHRFLLQEEIPVFYEESPGSHNMQFWDAKLEPAIRWMLED